MAASPALLKEPEELDVIITIAEFPSMLSHVARYVEPHRITTYSRPLPPNSISFTRNIVSSPTTASCPKARLLLTIGVRNTIRLALDRAGSVGAGADVAAIGWNSSNPAIFLLAKNPVE